MKKTDWIYLASLAAYSYLFWEQVPGVNFLIMNLVLIGALILRDQTVLKNRAWIITACASVITSFSVACYGNPLSVIANVISLSVTAAFVMHKQNSFFTTLFLSWLNGVTAIGFMIVAAIERFNRMGGNRSGNHRTLKRTLIVVVVLVIGLIFFMMYRESSLLFESFTDKIDLSFVSIAWCAFMILGVVLHFGFFRQQKFAVISEWDSRLPKDLTPRERTTLLDRIMSIDSEYFTGLVLLGMLNGLLLIVNILDIVFVAGGESILPKDVTYSQYVHQGVGMLMFSIILASLIIVFLFRNFHEKGKSYKHLRWLAFLWVAQNMFMVAMSIYRNHSYVFVYGLTYKRIGVDVWLLLAFAGLAFMIWKLHKQKTNMFVIRQFGWACFAVLVVSAPINWDKVIFNYNSGLQHRLDMMYANSLSYLSLPEQHKYHIDKYEQGYTTNWSSGRESLSSLSKQEHSGLQSKTFEFLSNYRSTHDSGKWPSYHLASTSVYNELSGMKSLSEDSTVYASNCGITGLYYHPCYADIHTLDVSGNEITQMGEIGKYEHLQSLNLSNNKELTSIGGIQLCKNLTSLHLGGTGVSDFGPITLMPQLRVLHVYYISPEWIERLNILNPNLQIKYSDEWTGQ